MVVAIAFMLFNIGQIIYYLRMVRKYERLGDNERKRLLSEYNDVES